MRIKLSSGRTITVTPAQFERVQARELKRACFFAGLKQARLLPQGAGRPLNARYTGSNHSPEDPGEWSSKRLEGIK